MGFENVCDYVAGKQDWLAHGLPIEGELAAERSVGQLARRDVPTCRLDEKLSEVGERLQPTGAQDCVVVSDTGIVLGLLRRAAWEGIDSGILVEQSMDPAPATFRPHLRAEEMLPYMQKKKLKSVLISTSGGTLIGVLRRKELEEGHT